MIFNPDPICPGWAPRVHTNKCPATPEEDAAFTAGFTFGWRQLPCGVNSRGNHFCKFQYLTEDGMWHQTYRYYNVEGSYYYRGSNGKGFYYDPVTRRQHISTYGADGQLKEREYLPFDEDQTRTVSVDAFPETTVKQDVKAEDYEIKIEEQEANLEEREVKQES